MVVVFKSAMSAIFTLTLASIDRCLLKLATIFETSLSHVACRSSMVAISEPGPGAGEGRVEVKTRDLATGRVGQAS